MQEKSIIKQNILKYLDFKGITPYKFYQDSGITRGILGQNNGMSEENTTKFLAYSPDVNIEWLLTGKGPMLRDQVLDIKISGAEIVANTIVENINYKELADARLEIIDYQKEKIERLERELSELKYAHKESFLYHNVAEPAPELIKKSKK